MLDDLHATADLPSRSDPRMAERPSLDTMPQARAPAGASPGMPTIGAAGRPATADAPATRMPRKRLRYSAVAVLIAAVLGAGYIYWENASHYETTDDAFIAARSFSLAPKVSGYIKTVLVTDNQHVKAGDVIAVIDDRDYRAALQLADAQVAAAQDTIANTDAQIDVQRATIASAAAKVQQQQATLVYTRQQSSRYGALARDGAGSQQNAQQWVSQELQDESALKAAQQSEVAAQRQLDVLKAQRGQGEADLDQARAQQEQARLNLSYTTIVAAQAGRVVQLSGAVGEYVQAGTALAMFVPDDIWVTANFKENQLDQLRPGQAVSLHVDAYPELTLHGHVASVQPGSGTAFSLLPVENATGNYVKVVQRVPVKITLDNLPTQLALGPGMSVVPTVRSNPGKSIAERLEDTL